ncbi:MAG: DUF169 domain-containing protein [Deltaproteobacteria bacterium]|nr:DUF169 domain-containing protein [Deltaproteobacteria bacterium]
MKKIKRLEDKFGAKWTGIRVHYGYIPEGIRVKREMRLCEAIAESFDRTIILPADMVNCPGARRSLGLIDNDKELCRMISEKTGVSFDSVYKALETVPQFAMPVSAITLGRLDAPHIVISFMKPDIAMAMVRKWQTVFGKGPEMEISTFLSICGGVQSAVFQKAQMYISLGCPSSRNDGIIKSDELAVGLPYGLIDALTQD